MKLHQAEHILRSAGAILQGRENNFCVIGSQAILGTDPSPPGVLALSMELDIYPMTLAKEDGEIVDAVIGDGSSFHSTFGYYADGVSHSAPVLPEGWRDRLLPICSDNTGGVTGWCLEVHDIAASKYIAGRAKDLAYNRALADHDYIDEKVVLRRLDSMGCSGEAIKRAKARARADFTKRPDSGNKQRP